MNWKWLRLVVAVVGCLAVVLGVASSADYSRPTTKEYFEKWDEHFKDLSEMRAGTAPTSGTGFKPYQRFRWFYEPRLSPTGSMIPGVRWQAYEQLKEMVNEKGREGETWFTMGPTNVGGRCLALAVHPTNSDIVYAGFASGGLWKTEDSGSTWVPLGDYLPTMSVGAIEIDPDDPDRMWIGTGEGWGNIDAVHGVGLLRSLDGGVTWETTGFDYALSQGLDVFELAYNPATGTLLLGAENGLFRSTDGGDSFTEIFEYGKWTDVELKKGSTDTFFACSYYSADMGFQTSTDDGLTWTKSTVGVPVSGFANQRIALCEAYPDIIYWALADYSGGAMKGIWRSVDGGATFNQQFSGVPNHYNTQGWYNLTIAVDPTNPNYVMSGGVNYYRSTNGASSFSQIASNVHVDHHATAWDPSDPSIFWVGTDGGVYRSTNSGLSFQNKNLGLVTMQFYAMNQSKTLPTRAVGGTQDNGTWIFNNNPFWGQILGGDGFFCEIDYTDEDYVYGELYYGDHRRSSTGGSGMVPINSGITENGPWSTPTHMDFSNPAVLYAAHNSKVFRTANRGNSWTAITPDPLGGSGTSIHQSLNSPDNLVVTSTGTIWVSTDHGNTWINRTSGLVTGNTLSDSHYHPDDPNTIVITLKTYNSSLERVYKTTDQGLTWEPITHGLPVEPVNTIEIDPSNPDWYFIGTDLGVYVSFNAGATWTPFNVGLPHVVCSDLRLHNDARLLRVATHGRGMWEVDISDLAAPAAGVEPTNPEIKPLTLRVFGTPATNSVVLRFGLRRPGPAKLALYDVSGRLVKGVVDDFAQAKIDNATVDISDIPAGVYFARLEANGASISRKVVIER